VNLISETSEKYAKRLEEIRGEPMSKSRLLTYINCPRKFQFEYLCGGREQKPKPLDGSPLVIGTEVHEIYEWFYKQPEAAKITEPYYESIIRILDKHPLAYKYDKFMMNFALFNSETIIPDAGVPGYIPEGIELDLINKDMGMRGIIDVVAIQGDGSRVILDYKTGKKAKPITEYRLELTLYKIIYEATVGKPVSYVGIYFPAVNQLRMTGVEGRSYNEKGPLITEEDEMYAMAVLEDTREKINNNYFPVRPNFLCGWCDYQDECQKKGLLDL